MTTAYLRIQDVNSLSDILNYIRNVENKKDLIIFLDWDDTLVNPNKNKLIEPKVAKELFKYMIDNRIFYAIITARFYDTVCTNKRNLNKIRNNIETTIHPILNELGVPVNLFATDEHKKTIYKINNEKNKCVGILYMGIFFSEKKGQTIKNYLRQTGINKNKIVFVDDYEPYLTETTLSVPNIEAFRRIVPNY